MFVGRTKCDFSIVNCNNIVFGFALKKIKSGLRGGYSYHRLIKVCRTPVIW